MSTFHNRVLCCECFNDTTISRGLTLCIRKVCFNGLVCLEHQPVWQETLEQTVDSLGG